MPLPNPKFPRNSQTWVSFKRVLLMHLHMVYKSLYDHTRPPLLAPRPYFKSRKMIDTPKVMLSSPLEDEHDLLETYSTDDAPAEMEMEVRNFKQLSAIAPNHSEEPLRTSPLSFNRVCTE